MKTMGLACVFFPLPLSKDPRVWLGINSRGMEMEGKIISQMAPSLKAMSMLEVERLINIKGLCYNTCPNWNLYSRQVQKPNSPPYS